MFRYAKQKPKQCWHSLLAIIYGLVLCPFVVFAGPSDAVSETEARCSDRSCAVAIAAKIVEAADTRCEYEPTQTSAEVAVAVVGIATAQARIGEVSAAKATVKALLEKISKQNRTRCDGEIVLAVARFAGQFDAPELLSEIAPAVRGYISNDQLVWEEIIGKLEGGDRAGAVTALARIDDPGRRDGAELALLIKFANWSDFLLIDQVLKSSALGPQTRSKLFYVTDALVRGQQWSMIVGLTAKLRNGIPVYNDQSVSQASNSSNSATAPSSNSNTPATSAHLSLDADLLIRSAHQAVMRSDRVGLAQMVIALKENLPEPAMRAGLVPLLIANKEQRLALEYQASSLSSQRPYVRSIIGLTLSGYDRDADRLSTLLGVVEGANARQAMRTARALQACVTRNASNCPLASIEGIDMIFGEPGGNLFTLAAPVGISPQEFRQRQIRTLELSLLRLNGQVGRSSNKSRRGIALSFLFLDALPESRFAIKQISSLEERTSIRLLFAEQATREQTVPLMLDNAQELLEVLSQPIADERLRRGLQQTASFTANLLARDGNEGIARRLSETLANSVVDVDQDRANACLAVNAARSGRFAQGADFIRKIKSSATRADLWLEIAGGPESLLCGREGRDR
jgi:hypothetical protein